VEEEAAQRTFLKFEGQKYAEDHKDVFIQLRERATITELYGAIRECLVLRRNTAFS